MLNKRHIVLIGLITFILIPAAAFGEGRVVVTTQETTLSKTPGGAGTDNRATFGAVLRWTGDMDSGWYRVVLRNGETGWIAGWNADRFDDDAPLPPAFAPDALPAPVKPLYGVSVADNVGWRSVPYGGLPAKIDTTRGGIIPRGAIVKLTDKIGHWFQAQASTDDFVWVYDEALAPPAEPPATNANGLPTANLAKVTFGRTAEGIRFEFQLDHPVPYLVKSNLWPPSETATLFGVDCEKLPSDFEMMCAAAEAECSCAPGTAKLEIRTPAAGPLPAGAEGNFEENIFSFTVRNPIASPIRKIVIDPGHGHESTPPRGYLAGTKTKSGLLEKDAVLSISKKLAEVLREDGYTVYLTREDDASALFDIYRRVAFSDKLGADLFISIHANGDENPASKGAEVYWYEPQSRPLAEMIGADLSTATWRAPAGVFYASFGVIRQTRVPAVLVETGYMTNVEEGKKFSDPAFVERCAAGIASGIDRYIKSLNAGVRP